MSKGESIQLVEEFIGLLTELCDVRAPLSKLTGELQDFRARMKASGLNDELATELLDLLNCFILLGQEAQKYPDAMLEAITSCSPRLRGVVEQVMAEQTKH